MEITDPVLDTSTEERSRAAQADSCKSPRTKRRAPPIPSSMSTTRASISVDAPSNEESQITNLPRKHSTRAAVRSNTGGISSAILSMVTPLAQTSGGLKVQPTRNRSPGSSIKLKRNPLVHQSSSSSPMRRSRGMDSSLEGSDIHEQTFLSNIASSRPLATSGFLGVASAALAAARASSPIGTGHPSPTSYKTNLDRRGPEQSAQLKQQHNQNISPHLLLQPGSPRMGPRRHSDTMLSSSGIVVVSTPQQHIYYCSRCNSFATRNQTLMCSAFANQGYLSPEWHSGEQQELMKLKHHVSMAQLPRSQAVSPMGSQYTTSPEQRHHGFCPHCANHDLVKSCHLGMPAGNALRPSSQNCITTGKHLA
ncbi:hypothetical protein Ciccas_011389 [Cichlidogyrus casuarinus]|uniref:Uncharacterized protein n=1 Tax=Cichlidogyrus casuarinus TaxID=1844966 RepID=A0ABD2PRE1_9PLAT